MSQTTLLAVVKQLVVPSGRQRSYGNRDLHFITGSCYRREPQLGSKRRRNLFLRVLEQVRLRYRFVVLGYVVMPARWNWRERTAFVDRELG